jgi:Fe-S-cluster-containing dehydrogenase component
LKGFNRKILKQGIMTKYGMAIDLQRCVGCGACALACKTENNTDIEQNGKRFNWADFYVNTEGKFSQGNLKHWVFPTLCNHCSNAPCIENCPVTPKALFKTPEGITMLNHVRCINCGSCTYHCPYSDNDVDAANVQYSVITRNSGHINPHPFYDNDVAIIPGCTMSPAEIAGAVGERPPNVNEYDHPDSDYVRPKNTSEKCTFCEHRVVVGSDPYCVASCPAYARMFGDLDDPQSEINEWLAKGYVRLKNNKGDLIAMNASSNLEPNIYYIGFTGPVGIQEQKPSKAVAAMKIFPNPAKDQTNIALSVSSACIAVISVFDVSGKEVMRNENTYHLNRGENRFVFDIATLRQGTYIVRIVANTEVFSSNLVVMR